MWWFWWFWFPITFDRQCGPVVSVPGYSSRDSGFDSRRYQILWEIMGLERRQLSLVRITEELLEWKCSGSGSRKPRLKAVGTRCADHATLCTLKLPLTSPTSGGLSVGIVRLRSKATEFNFSILIFSGDDVTMYVITWWNTLEDALARVRL
jgi:hypothetical protein